MRRIQIRHSTIQTYHGVFHGFDLSIVGTSGHHEQRVHAVISGEGHVLRQTVADDEGAARSQRRQNLTDGV